MEEHEIFYAPEIASDTEEVEVKKKSIPSLKLPEREPSRADKRKRFLAAQKSLDREDEADILREQMRIQQRERS